MKYTGEGNGNPLQSSCLENPMDGGAWWAAVHGVAESRTGLQFHFHFSLSCIVEGNGNPLQCSCLENPRDGGAWWAAVYGVAQSWTRLKRLSDISCEIHIATYETWKETLLRKGLISLNLFQQRRITKTIYFQVKPRYFKGNAYFREFVIVDISSVL